MGNEVGLIKESIEITALDLFPSPMGNEVGLIEMKKEMEKMSEFLVSVPYGE